MIFNPIISARGIDLNGSVQFLLLTSYSIPSFAVLCHIYCRDFLWWNATTTAAACPQTAAATTISSPTILL